MKKNVKLPTKQSQLLRLAIKDVQEIQKNKKYVLSMDEWHTPSHSGECSVCLAGAVMACTLKVPSNKYATPGTDRLIGDNYTQLQTINYMRLGEFRYTGSDQDRITAVETVCKLVTKNYNFRLHRASWKIYLRAATILESVGL